MDGNSISQLYLWTTTAQTLTQNEDTVYQWCCHMLGNVYADNDIYQHISSQSIPGCVGYLNTTLDETITIVLGWEKRETRERSKGGWGAEAVERWWRKCGKDALFCWPVDANSTSPRRDTDSRGFPQRGQHVWKGKKPKAQQVAWTTRFIPNNTGGDSRKKKQTGYSNNTYSTSILLYWWLAESR